LEELWYNYFKDVDESKYKIYIHYKLDKPLKYFEKYKLKNCIETNYADETLIHAHNILFKEGLKDDCYKIISLSQSCVPLKPFDYVYEFLTKDKYSHFNVCPDRQCWPKCERLLGYYSKKVIKKSSNWFILNKPHCEIVTSMNKNMINIIYSKILSPEEIFFITTLYHNKKEDEIQKTNNSSNNATTFTNWPDMDYKYVFIPKIGDRLPKNYDVIREEELNYLMNSNCLFGRKFTKNSYSSFINSKYMNKIIKGEIAKECEFEKQLESIKEKDGKLYKIMTNIRHLNSIR
jgi:hypothetical protein